MTTFDITPFTGRNYTPDRLKLAETLRLQCEDAIYAIEQDQRDGDLTDAEAADRMAPYEDHLEHCLRYINDYRAHAAKVLENVRRRKDGA